MRYLIGIFLLCFITSCQNVYIEDGQFQGDPNEITTLSVLNSMDTTNTYYLYVYESQLYAINTETHVAEYRIIDNSGVSWLGFLFVLICGFVIGVMFIMLIYDFR